MRCKIGLFVLAVVPTLAVSAFAQGVRVLEVDTGVVPREVLAGEESLLIFEYSNGCYGPVQRVTVNGFDVEFKVLAPNAFALVVVLDAGTNRIKTVTARASSIEEVVGRVPGRLSPEEMIESHERALEKITGAHVRFLGSVYRGDFGGIPVADAKKIREAHESLLESVHRVRGAARLALAVIEDQFTHELDLMELTPEKEADLRVRFNENSAYWISTVNRTTAEASQALSRIADEARGYSRFGFVFDDPAKSPKR